MKTALVSTTFQLSASHSFLSAKYTPYNRLFGRQITVSKTDANKFGRERVGEEFCLLNSTNEDDNCVEILQQQSGSISRTNKLLLALQRLSFKKIA